MRDAKASSEAASQTLRVGWGKALVGQKAILHQELSKNFEFHPNPEDINLFTSFGCYFTWL